jgi:hypothetical protein
MPRSTSLAEGVPKEGLISCQSSSSRLKRSDSSRDAPQTNLLGRFQRNHGRMNDLPSLLLELLRFRDSFGSFNSWYNRRILYVFQERLLSMKSRLQGEPRLQGNSRRTLRGARGCKVERCRGRAFFFRPWGLV